MIATDKNQLTLIYNSESYLGKQVLAYVQGIGKKIDSIDISKQQLKDSVWIDVSKMLNLPFKAIFEVQNKAWFKESSKEGKSFDDEDWVKLINGNPKLLERPIAIVGDKAKIISRHSEILEFFNVDSSGLKKTLANEEPTVSTTTEGETFLKNSEQD